MGDDLDDLFAPKGAAAFFASHWERAPMHTTRTPDLGAALLTRAAFVDALSSFSGVPAGLMAFPETFAPSLDTETLLGDPSLLDAYLAAGRPIVWNRARGVWPAVDALTATLADAFGAQVWPNVYATGTAGTPFDAHFDTHEVIAVQCEGAKRWWISEVRVDRPTDAAGMESVVARELRARQHEALERTLARYVVRPGDVVYVPRGQFHNASALDGFSLHVTFGIRLPTAFDALQVLMREALGDPLMREYVRPRAADLDASGAALDLRAVVDGIAERFSAERVGETLSAVRAEMVRGSKAPPSKQR